MAERQALAALGQAQLIALQSVQRPVAPVLLTHDDLRNRPVISCPRHLERTLSLVALPG